MAESPTPWSHRRETDALQKLRLELQDDAAVDRFVADFLDLLDQRLAEVDRLLGRLRWEDAITVLLTIETSGRMIGAHDLVVAATELRQGLSGTEPAAAAGLACQVRSAGEATKRMFGQV